MDLRRRTSSGRFIPEIDGLRFFCITPVVLTHLVTTMVAENRAWELTTPYRVLMLGANGVQLFFVISGFVLVLPFARAMRDCTSRPSLRAYFVRRVTRLEPPYLLAMPIGAIATMFASGIGLAVGLPHLLAGLVYGHSLAYGTKNPVNPITWSLEVEIQFYLLLPIFAFVFAIRRPLARRAAIVVGALVLHWAFIRLGVRALDLSVFGHLSYFAAGFILADLYLHEWREAPPTSRLWNLVPIPATLGFFALRYDSRFSFLRHLPQLGYSLDQALPAVLVLVLFVSAFRAPAFRRLLSIKWLTVVGGMCYSIYLLHQVALDVVWKLGRRVLDSGPMTAFLAVWLVPSFAAVLLLSGCFYVLVERPCMDPAWPQRVFRMRRGSDGGVDATPRPEGAPVSS